MKAVKYIDEREYNDDWKRRLKEIFMLSKQQKKLQESFEKARRKLKEIHLKRRQEKLDKRDKIIQGELADELTDYDNDYTIAFANVEQIAKGIVRLEDGVEEISGADSESEKKDE